MSEDREKKIIQLFHAQGYAEIVGGYMDKLFERLKPLLGEKEQELTLRFQKELVEKCFDLSVEIYAKTFSDEELDYMLSKQEHPIEKSIREKSPTLLSDLVARISEFVEEASSRIEKELDEEGWGEPGGLQ